MKLPRRLPHLDERRTALLAEMGVVPWWAPRALLPYPANAIEPQTPAATPSAVPAMPAAAPVAQHERRAHPVAHLAGAAAAAALDQQEAPNTAPAPSRAPHATRGALGPADDVAVLEWGALEAAIHACQRCALAQCRQRAVPGVGDRQPNWLIVGEAPGEEEDRQGEPFVGRAGRLLDRMLAAVGLQRGQGVYIANVIKCRPPRNRNPQPDEIARCTPFLLRQIALLRPRIVLAMGRFAAHTLLAEGGCDSAENLARTPLGKLRGQVHHARISGLALPIVVTYHPAYLLRNPADKAKAWADLCLALQTAEEILL